jgi:hypothetical protein
MGSRARKFVPRAPRYELNAKDNRFLRFAHNNEPGQSYTTQFIDISQTGLAFITDQDNAPRVSELIKVEIPLENNQSIAWWARVVRVEEYAPHKWYLKKEHFHGSDQVLVAITFHDLPPAHARQIRETLNLKFDEMFRTERRHKMQQMAVFVVSEFWRLFLYGLCIIATFALLYYLSRPSENYDAKKGTPWMQRFPQFNIPSSDK